MREEEPPGVGGLSGDEGSRRVWRSPFRIMSAPEAREAALDARGSLCSSPALLPATGLHGSRGPSLQRRCWALPDPSLVGVEVVSSWGPHWPVLMGTSRQKFCKHCSWLDLYKFRCLSTSPSPKALQLNSGWAPRTQCQGRGQTACRSVLWQEEAAWNSISWCGGLCVAARSHCDVPPPCAGDQGGCGVGGVWRRLGRGEGWHSGPSCSQVPLRSENRSCHPLSTSSSVRGCGAPLPPLMATWWWGTLCVPLGWNGRRHRMTGIMQRDRGLLCLPSSGPGGLWGPLWNKPPQNIVAEEQRP